MSLVVSELANYSREELLSLADSIKKDPESVATRGVYIYKHRVMADLDKIQEELRRREGKKKTMEGHHIKTKGRRK